MEKEKRGKRKGLLVAWLLVGRYEEFLVLKGSSKQVDQEATVRMMCECEVFEAMAMQQKLFYKAELS